jgi:GH18 family chitinase
MITREQVLKEIQEQGIETIKNKFRGHRKSDHQVYIDTIQELESSNVLERKEDREEQSLTIAREANSISAKALDVAKCAQTIAIIAIIISIIVTIINIFCKK